jgi:hypothetical protein
MTTASRELEILVARIQKQLAPQAEVLHDVKLDGRLSKTQRQVDVLVRQTIGQYEIRIVIDCKDYNKPVDVKGVEEFDGLVRDVGAEKGVLVCPKGFTEAAKARAEGLQIALYSPVDTGDHKWRARVTIPALCDFRTAAMSFGISVSAPVPFRMPYDFYQAAVAFDDKDKELGTALDAALKKWNDGGFPIDVGTHERLDIFDRRAVFMDNGYDPPLRARIPVELTVSVFVKRELYFGPLPVLQISGFKDEFSGKVITNSFTVGMIDPSDIERDWRKIDNESEAPVEPVVVLKGLIGWADA